MSHKCEECGTISGSDVGTSILGHTIECFHIKEPGGVTELTAHYRKDTSVRGQRIYHALQAHAEDLKKQPAEED